MSSQERRNSKTVGVIDIGSNSVRLLVALVADKQAHTVYRDIITTRLLSKASNGVLAKESVDRTNGAIRQLILKAGELGAQDVLGFGTCAMREGKNSGEIVDSAAELGVKIEILSGSMEAEMAFRGAPFGNSHGIIDIGGGSTELIVGDMDKVLCSKSVPVGAVRLFETESCEEAGELFIKARDMLRPAWEAVKNAACDSWTGVGGTITSLASMSMCLVPYDSERVNGYTLARDEAENWYYALCKMSVEERKALPGIKANRADIIPFGAAILAAFFDMSGAESISVTENDNMLGYLKMKYGLD